MIQLADFNNTNNKKEKIPKVTCTYTKEEIGPNERFNFYKCKHDNKIFFFKIFDENTKSVQTEVVVHALMYINFIEISMRRLIHQNSYELKNLKGEEALEYILKLDEEGTPSGLFFNYVAKFTDFLRFCNAVYRENNEKKK